MQLAVNKIIGLYWKNKQAHLREQEYQKGK